MTIITNRKPVVKMVKGAIVSTHVFTRKSKLLTTKLVNKRNATSHILDHLVQSHTLWKLLQSSHSLLKPVNNVDKHIGKYVFRLLGGKVHFLVCLAKLLNRCAYL